MKKMLIVIAAVALLTGYTVIAAADSTSTTVPLQFTVPAAFGFTLDQYSHDFGTIPAPGGQQTTIGISCRSNHGVKWMMALKADPFACGAIIMPSDPGFKFAPWSNAGAEQAQGDFVPETGGAVVPATETVFYTSTNAEGSDSYVPMVLGLYVAVPAGQASGLYETDLVLTMHE